MQPTQLTFSEATQSVSVAFNEAAQDFIVMGSILAPYFEASARAPITLVAAIDRSGSMEGEKLKLVQETLQFTIPQLKSTDRLGLIVYDDQVATILPLTFMDTQGRSLAKKAVDSMRSGGFTNLCAGLALEMQNNRPTTKNEITSVLLLTDGLTNTGIQKTPEILEAMLGPSQQPPSCSVHTFGYGKDHDSTMLKSISDSAQGTYFFLDTKDSVPNAFSDCLGGLLSVVGQNIFVTVEGLNGAIIETIHTDYQKVREDGKITVRLGDIQSEEERDVLVSVSIPVLSKAQHDLPIIRWSVTYFSVIDSKHYDYSCETTLHRPTTVDASQTHSVNPKIDQQKNRVRAANAIKVAKDFADQSQLKEARNIINETISTLENSVSASDPFVLSLLQDLKTSYAGLHDQMSYSSRGGYVMDSFVSCHSQQRSNPGTSSYKTTARTVTKESFQ